MKDLYTDPQTERGIKITLYDLIGAKQETDYGAQEHLSHSMAAMRNIQLPIPTNFTLHKLNTV